MKAKVTGQFVFLYLSRYYEMEFLVFKDVLSGLRQFLATESPLKIESILKALLVL